MFMNGTTQLQIVTLSAYQLKEIVSDAVSNAIAKVNPAKEAKDEPVYLVGLGGICKFFGCSKPQAIWYKKHVFPEAVMQCGRTILVDRDKAVTLFAEYDRKKMKR